MCLSKKEIEEIGDKVTVWNPFIRVLNACSTKLLGRLDEIQGRTFWKRAIIPIELTYLVKQSESIQYVFWFSKWKGELILAWYCGASLRKFA